ncbi:DUF1450 domain-containing protein [Tumebacillus permanentifrigoris]|uniref:Uncharacterized protein YuzB (UPF0349 family) n=1 Tax=Tumebacillus permanentifrigoris TaxID=378543 RepID=A0A316DA72_9BACL|nr:DUF1450 domain-containing protein [Tumebacillus permanentifrigoris]PWK14391.1 uncharacterized protein YuzB (UPF0349 family) [Tumebacillus permanentifrigoris]
MGIVIVEVCDINPASALDLEQLEEDFPGVSAIRTPCLSNCTMCASTPYVYVNGELLANADREVLLTQIRELIQQELSAWESEF